MDSRLSHIQVGPGRSYLPETPTGDKRKRLNIGCGRDYRRGWWNCDISPEVEADAHLDICKSPLPFKDESADEIWISGVLEQIRENADLIFVLNECHRVMKTGQRMMVVVPNARYAIAHRDPMDVRKFTIETFSYFIGGSAEYKLYGSVYGFKPWSSIRVEESARHIFVAFFTK